MSSPVPPPGFFRRKKENRRGITYSILLLGPAGTGKTTFANNLIETNVFPHKHSAAPYPQNPNKKGGVKDNTSKIKISNPTKVVSFSSKSGLPPLITEFDPNMAQMEPGISIISTSFEITPAERRTGSDGNYPQYDEDGEDEDTIFLNLTMTSGLGENLDDTLYFDEITGYLEQQFDIVLAEETRIKRNPRFEDTRVHVALYFIEPVGHGLRELDVELMKRISRYTNVLPIIAKADSFTKDELKEIRNNILNDIERYNVPVYKFEIDPDDDDIEAIEENQALAALQPFAIICSDEKDDNGNYVRRYPWGTVNVDDDKVSDLRILKNVLFGTHLQEFKDTTQNLLYENYRTEKLSTVTTSASATRDFDLDGGTGLSRRASTAPSLSNFASLVQTGHFKSSQSLALQPTPDLNGKGQELPETGGRGGSNSNGVGNGGVNNGPSGRSTAGRLASDTTAERESLMRTLPNEKKTQLRNISETVPYVLRHERIIAKQQKLEELEAQSARELQRRIQELERKAHELKMKEKMLKYMKEGGNNSKSSFHSAQSSELANQSDRTSAEPKIKTEDNTSELGFIA